MEATTEALRERAAVLREGAVHLLDGVGVREEVRARLGGVAVVGSVDLDLMVWPDVDLYVALEPDDAGRLLALLPPLHARLERAGWRLARASFHDEYRRPGSVYGEGLYCGLRVLPPDGAAPWKVDLWGWSPATLERRMEEHRELGRRLAAVDRDLVLRLKDAAHRWPEYRDTVTSMDVYRFALEGAGTTPDQLRAFVRRRDGSGAPLA